MAEALEDYSQDVIDYYKGHREDTDNPHQLDGVTQLGGMARSDIDAYTEKLVGAGIYPVSFITPTWWVGTQENGEGKKRFKSNTVWFGDDGAFSLTNFNAMLTGRTFSPEYYVDKDTVDKLSNGSDYYIYFRLAKGEPTFDIETSKIGDTLTRVFIASFKKGDGQVNTIEFYETTRLDSTRLRDFKTTYKRS